MRLRADCMALDNVMIYEDGAMCPTATVRSHGEGGCGDPRVLPSGVTLQFHHNFAFTATDDLLWKINVPGATDQEKMDNLVTMAQKSADYLVLPDDPTLTWLEVNIARNLMNVKTRELKTRLLATGAYERIGEPNIVSPYETIEVYARRQR
jgi:hypothetical protein